MMSNQPANDSTNQRFNQSTNQLFNYILHLADNALILGHRNSEWTGHGPILEQDIALSNIALDLMGQARNFYQYAAQLSGDGSTEDTLAYFRNANEFRNYLLVEQSNGDWGKTILRQFLFSVHQYYLYQQLQDSNDKTIASIAEKALKEVNYHVRWSGEWVIRLGDGTEDSHARMKHALDELWKYTDELFIPASYETKLRGDVINADLSSIKGAWDTKVESVFEEATLALPPTVRNTDEIMSGKEGQHTNELSSLLAEMQFMQRTYPDCEW
jgi:ring-1,2-phenylacetyl-CoA epoxidase subunit PaaC